MPIKLTPMLLVRARGSYEKGYDFRVAESFPTVETLVNVDKITHIEGVDLGIGENFMHCTVIHFIGGSNLLVNGCKEETEVKIWRNL